MSPTSTAPELSDIQHIIVRDLQALAREVEQTPEDLLWKGTEGIHNTVGTIAVHLCGNLQHFIGHEIGDNGYIRDRNAEFSGMPRPKAQVLDEISLTMEVVDGVLSNLAPSRLDDPMPNPPPHHAGRNIRFFLFQLSCHLSRHMGQANYLRRILD